MATGFNPVQCGLSTAGAVKLGNSIVPGWGGVVAGAANVLTNPSCGLQGQGPGTYSLGTNTNPTTGVQTSYSTTIFGNGTSTYTITTTNPDGSSTTQTFNVDGSTTTTSFPGSHWTGRPL